MSKAREMAEIISTPPSIYSTDAEVAATYLTQASASTTYLTQENNRTAFKNLIINGDMQVAQRSSSVASITTGGYYTADRWNFGPSSMGTWTMSVENDAPTGSGFRKSAKVLCTTADASPASADEVVFIHKIEGQNLQQIAKGTSSAKQLTLSFWVKSNVTGTYVVSFYDNDNNRLVNPQYTISTSGTWEKKTLTVNADTTGAFDNDNASSLELYFTLGAGSSKTSGTSSSSWGSYSTANFAAGQTNLAASTNNYWQITGVQLEVGSVATEFEFLPAQVELALCERYYQVLDIPVESLGAQYSSGGTAFYSNPLVFPTTMRTTPSSITYTNISFGNAWVIVGANSFSANSAAGQTFFATPTAVKIQHTRQSGGAAPTVGNYYVWEARFTLGMSAEL